MRPVGIKSSPKFISLRILHKLRTVWGKGSGDIPNS